MDLEKARISWEHELQPDSDGREAAYWVGYSTDNGTGAEWLVPRHMLVTVAPHGRPSVQVRTWVNDAGVCIVRSVEFCSESETRGVLAVDLPTPGLETLRRAALTMFARIPDPGYSIEEAGENPYQRASGVLNYDAFPHMVHARFNKLGNVIVTRGIPPYLLKVYSGFDFDSPTRRPAKNDPVTLEQIASVYRKHIHDKAPTQAVALEFHLSERTASRRITQAREAGLLPQTTPGKKLANTEKKGMKE